MAFDPNNLVHKAMASNWFVPHLNRSGREELTLAQKVMALVVLPAAGFYGALHYTSLAGLHLVKLTLVSVRVLPGLGSHEWQQVKQNLRYGWTNLLEGLSVLSLSVTFIAFVILTIASGILFIRGDGFFLFALIDLLVTCVALMVIEEDIINFRNQLRRAAAPRPFHPDIIHDYTNPSTSSRSNWDIAISYQKVKDAPFEVIDNDLTRLNQTRPGAKDLWVRYLDDNGLTQLGIDSGGLKRDFITTLFSSFAKRCSKDPYELVGGTIIPKATLPVGISEVESRRFKILGKLMGIAKTQSCLIGKIFPKKVFSMILSLPKSLYSSSFSSLSEADLLRFYFCRHDGDQRVRMYQNFRTSTPLQLKSQGLWNQELILNALNEWPEILVSEGEPDIEKIENHFSQFLAQMKKEFLQQARTDQSLPAIFALGAGFAGHFTHLEWNAMIARGFDQLEFSLQGRLTKDSLLSKLDIADPTLSGYFNRWILETEEETLAKFVQAATGSQTLGIDAKIRVQVKRVDTSRADSSPIVFHTCSKTVDIIMYPNYEKFKEYLNIAIDAALITGFIAA